MSKTPFGYDYCGSCLWHREHVRGVKHPEACPECGNGITYLAYTGGGPARMIREIAALRRQLAEAQEQARVLAVAWDARRAWDRHILTCDQCASEDLSERYCDDGCALLRRRTSKALQDNGDAAARAILAGEKGDVDAAHSGH